jgi:hypothetical protein
MIWFQQFLKPISDTRFQLETEAVQPLTLSTGEDSEWGTFDAADRETDQLVTASADLGPSLGL